MATYKGAAYYGQGPLQRGDWLRLGLARKGRHPPVAKPQGQPLEGDRPQLGTCKDGVGRHLAGRLSMSKGSCRLHRGDDDDTVRMREEG
ncbi:hypothetical protein GW17_00057140 [Ensete ventricosum]|nr:hypothetical protein GW17_00057140 [Ensete ventricosum]